MTPPHTSTTARAQEVAVIGSGPSGLAATFRIEQARYRVRVFVFAAFMSRQKFFALRGGMGFYAEMLGRRFDVTLDAEVQGVGEKGSAVELTWRDQAGVDHVESFQGAVIASLPKQAATIHTKIDPFRRELLATGNASIAAIQVALDRVPPETASRIYSTEQSQKDAILAASLEHRKLPGRYPEGKSLITLYANSSSSLDLLEQDDDLITKKLLDAGTALVPTVGDDILFTHVTRWPYSWMQSYPGYWTAMRGFRKAGSGDTRIQLAGDYFCTSTSTPPAPRVSGPLATFSPTFSHLTQHRKERTRLCRRRSSFPASELPSPRSPSSSG